MASKLTKAKGLKAYRNMLEEKIAKQKSIVREAELYTQSVDDEDDYVLESAEHDEALETIRLNTLEEVYSEIFNMEQNFRKDYMEEELQQLMKELWMKEL